MERTFVSEFNDEMSETVYVTGNHYADRINMDSLKVVDQVRKYDYGDLPLPPAHVVTDRAISVGRQYDFNRCIVHYMQPHKPFLERTGDRQEVRMIEETGGVELYRKYLDGELSKRELSDGFINNLRYVLEEVELLLSNFDAQKAVITSDHGQALGERFLFDHRYGINHPKVRQVPWVRTEGEDTLKHNPSCYNIDSTDRNVGEHLVQLGYK